MEQEDEDNKIYAAFIKAFAPVLLHLAPRNPQIKDIIKEFQDLPEDAVPNRSRATTLRNWVDSKQDAIDALTPEEIEEIMNASRLTRIDETAFHTRQYSLGARRTRETCAITMEPIKPNEYYVDFLDGGKPYKVAAIIEYYKRMKESTLDRSDWKTPLRNQITREQEDLLEDLVKWYDNSKRCLRKRRTRSKSKSPSNRRRRDQNAGRKIRNRTRKLYNRNH